MIQTQPVTPAQVATFLSDVAAMVHAHFDRELANQPKPTFEAMEGKKFIRIVRRDGHGHGGSVHCFLDRSNGNVLKADGWKRPHPLPRSNLNDPKRGMGGITVYGAVYAR